jgi:hypothetical protein
MTIITDIGAALEMFSRPVTVGNRHVVTTQFLYPSNTHVSVYVAPGLAGELFVSDGGGALDTLSAHGIEVEDRKRVFSVIKKYSGLKAEAGEVRATRLPKNVDLLGTAILTVARASVDVVEHGMSELRPRRNRNIEDEILATLQRYVGPSQIQRRQRISGASNRQYTFAFAVPRGRKGTLIIDSVEPEAASLQARFTAHMDVGRSQTRKIEQQIVYDDEREWKAEDLILLQMAATLVPLSQFKKGVRAWAA